MLTDQYARLFTISILFAAFIGAENLGNQSGIMAMAVFGILIGSSEVPYKKIIKNFKEDISIILLSIIFISLSTLIDFDSIKAVGLKGIILVLLLMLIIRPLAVFVSTYRSDLKHGEKIFISAMGPRGVVPASMAVYFSFRLRDVGFVSESTRLLGLIFITILMTVILTGLSARFIAKGTGVIPMEILVVGGGGVGRAIGERFLKRGENVVIIDNKEENCKKAIEIGIRAIHGDAENIDILRKAGIENSKCLVATTDQDNTNLLVCQIVKTKFGFTEDMLVARVSGEGDIVEIKVLNKKVIGKAIKDIRLPEDSLIVMIRRDNRSLIAHPEMRLLEGDYVTIIGKLEAVREAASMMK